MPRYVKERRRGFLAFLTWGCLLLTYGPVEAAVTPETVSRQLELAFVSDDKAKAPKTSIIEKSYVHLRTRTLVFGLGRNTYRIVFSSDGTLTVTLTQAGDIAAQSLWKGKTKSTSVEEIVNIVHMGQFGRPYKPTKRSPSAKADKAPTLTDHGTGAALRWDNLMNRLLQGNDVGISAAGGRGSSESSIDEAFSAARSMDPCANGAENTSQPQRAALENVALAMSALNRAEQLLADRSRDFEKRGSYAFLEDLDRHESRPRQQETFRLIKQSASDAHQMFRTALKKSDQDAKDPHALAALRNFRTVARHTGGKGGKALIESVLKKTVVNIEDFTWLRRSSPKTPVIYDAEVERYFVDPTLNSPSEARYLLSLAVLYEWKRSSLQVQKVLKQYQKVRREIAVIEQAVLDESDEQKLEAYRRDSRKYAEQLIQISEELRKLPAIPGS